VSDGRLREDFISKRGIVVNFGGRVACFELNGNPFAPGWMLGKAMVAVVVGEEPALELRGLLV
jgi:hypothetical protein